MDMTKVGDVNTIDRHHGCPMPLRLKTEPAIPRSDVEHALAAQVAGDRVACIPLALMGEAQVAIDPCSVRQLETMVPAVLGQFFAKACPPASFPN